MNASHPFELRYFQDASEFLLLTRAFLEEQEASSCLMLGLAETMSARHEPISAWAVVKKSQLQFLVFQTPPHNLILSAAPDLSSVTFAVQEIARRHMPFDFLGVVGPVHEAEVFKDSLAAERDLNFKLGFRQRLHQAHSVLLPVGVRGELKLAGASDLELVTDWSHKFVLEALPNEAAHLETLRSATQARLATGKVYLWMVDCEPVSQAAISRQTRNGISVSLVYTPIQHRGSGYASAVVGALTDLQLRSGRKFCTLYTDLANRTSNSIYHKVGYRPIADSIQWLRVAKV
jgi:predicted GNAT family acetyltransferase